MRFKIGIMVLSVLFLGTAWAAMPLAPAFGPNTYTIPAALGSLLPIDPPKQMPKTVFQDPSGGPISFTQFKGKRLVVFFWSEACAPCLKTMPSLNKMAERYAGQGFEVVPIAVDSTGAAGAKALLARQKWPRLKAYADPRRELATALGISYLPTAVLVDQAGMATAVLMGPQNWDGQDMLNAVMSNPSSKAK